MSLQRLLVLLVLLPLGCAATGFGSRGVSAEQRQAYDAAAAMIEIDAKAAEASLEDFLDRYPDSSLADDVAENLAELAFASGREDEGLRWLGRILSQAPDGDRAGPARLRLAQFEYGRDRWDRARSLLAPLRIERLPLADQRAAVGLSIALAQTPVQRLSRQSDLRRILLSEVADRATDPAMAQRLERRLETLDRDLREGIHGAATPELEELVDRRRDPDLAGQIQIELSRRALDIGDFESAEDRIDRAESLVHSEADLAELRLLRSRLVMLEANAEANADLPKLSELVDRTRPRTQGGRGKIGVVLPLSGRFADFGRESLRGLLLAAGLFAPIPLSETEAVAQQGSSDSKSFTDDRDAVDIEVASTSGRLELDDVEDRSRIRLIVRDSAGDPERAAAMVRELEEDSEIVAIVGPIFTDESLAAADAAEESGIPLVSLSHREEVPAGRSQVFRTRTTPGDEVNALVDYAFNELGARRFAVLYPRNPYGRGMRKLYWDAVMARGAKMVAASSFENGATDFSSAIRDMIGYRFITNLEREALVQREESMRKARFLPPEEALLVRQTAYSVVGPSGEPLPPIVDFDVLFIPDSADKVSLIAPGLAYHEINGVSLLGTGEWLDAKLLDVAHRHVAGSVISAPFYAESDLPFIAEFVNSYRSTFGEEPGSYAAQAFDAGNLILVQLAAGRDDRSEIRDGLLQTRAYPGATGVLTMRPDGNARRRPILLSVKGRRFVSLD